MKLRLFLVPFALTAVLLACNSPYNLEIPSDLSKVDDSYRASISKLHDDEKQLLVGYVMRASLGKAFGGSGIEKGTTVGDAIKRQRAWLDDKASGEKEAKAKQAAEEAKLEAERKVLRDALSMEFVDLRLLRSDYQAHRYGDDFAMQLRFTNNGKQAITAAKGAVEFRDPFGERIKRVSLKLTDTIGPGQVMPWSGSLKYNQFMDEDKALAAMPREKLQVVWLPESLLLADGKQVTVGGGL